MKTKKITMTMAALIGCMVMLLAGCLAENKLKLAVEAVNSQCPLSMGTAGGIENIGYEDGVVSFTLAINEQVSSIKAMSENPDIVKRTVITNFMNPDNKLKIMRDLIMDANASVRFVYKGKESGDTFEVMLTADELKATEGDSSFTAEDRLNAEIEATNVQLPMMVDEATVLEKLVVEGNSVVYLYKLDESTISIEDLKGNAEAAKENVRNSIVNGGPVVQNFLKKVLDTGRSLKYRYVGSESRESMELIFTTDDLQGILQ